MVGGQRHAPAALPPRKTRYPLYRRLSRTRAGLDGCGKSRPLLGFDPRTVQPVAIRYTNYATRPTTEKSTRDISWGLKATGAYGWKPYRIHVPIVLKSGSLKLLEPSGPVQVFNGIALPLLVSFEQPPI